MNRSRVWCVEVVMRVLFATVILAPALAAAAPYDKMFELGTTMTYDETRSVKYGVTTDSKPREESTRATCRVAEVETIAGARVSTIECDKHVSVAGHWMSTKKGVWRISHPDRDEVRRALRTRPMLAARPKKLRVENRSAEGMGESHIVTRDGARWCVEQSSSDPNGEGESTTCFANGLVVHIDGSGVGWSEGGFESRSTTVLVPSGT